MKFDIGNKIRTLVRADRENNVTIELGGEILIQEIDAQMRLSPDRMVKLVVSDESLRVEPSFITPIDDK